MIDHSFNIKFIDLGIAKDMVKNDLKNERLLTPKYFPLSNCVEKF